MILPYIVNVALILSTCLVFYKLLLRRETFYKVNRYMLITCLAISFALPLLQVPAEFSLRKNRETSDVKRETSNVNQSAVGSQQSAINDKQPVTTTQQPTTNNQPITDSPQPVPGKEPQTSNFPVLVILVLLVWCSGVCYQFSFPGGVIALACLSQPGDY